MFQEEDAATQTHIEAVHNENARVCTHGVGFKARNDAILLSPRSAIESFCAAANAKLLSQAKERQTREI
jgi:hypothetical protein